MQLKNSNPYFANWIRQNKAILYIPADVYKDAAGKEFTCGKVTYRIKVLSDKNDSGHNFFNVDPLDNVKDALDCDGKADIGMLYIALNCMPI